MDYSKILKIIVGIAILLFTINYIGFGSILGTFEKMNIIYLPAIICVVILSFVINSFNILLLANVFRPLSFPKAYDIVSASFAATMVTPGRIGQFSMIYLLKKMDLK